jgi:hypothetical protein
MLQLRSLSIAGSRTFELMPQNHLVEPSIERLIEKQR